MLVSKRQDMATANVTNDLEHFVNCGVCFCEFDEETRKPKFLQCAHTVCLKCLQAIYRLGYITCPFCRKAFFSDTASLPNNSYALQMIKLKEEREESKVQAGASSLVCGGQSEETKKLVVVLEKRKDVQGKLDLIMKSITAVGDEVKKLQEENNVEMAELISVIETTPKNSTYASLPSASTTSFQNLFSRVNTQFVQPLRKSYIFILKVTNSTASGIGKPAGVIRIRPTPTFHPEFVQKLGEFCHKFPKNFSSSIDKAQAGVFVSISMSDMLFRPTLGLVNQTTRITASKLGEVGITGKKRIPFSVSSSTVTDWNFFLPLNPVHRQQKKVVTSTAAQLFGHIIDNPNSPNQTVMEMSRSTKDERGLFRMTLESEYDS